MMDMEREEAWKKCSRSLSVPSPDLAGGPDLSLPLPACGAAQGEDYGNSHQPREYDGPELQPFQPVGLTCLLLEAPQTAQFSIVAVRRVLVCGAKGVQVGEASSPGPDEVPLTQWESGAECSFPGRGSGLMATV